MVDPTEAIRRSRLPETNADPGASAVKAIECPLCHKHETEGDPGYQCLQCSQKVCQECIVLSQGQRCENCVAQAHDGGRK